MTSEVIVRRRRGGTDFTRTFENQEGIMTDTQTASATTALRFSPEFWAAFWAAPSMSHSMDILADDIIGYWPGDSEPVRGLAAYTQKIADLLALGHASGPNGPIEIRGLDRVRTRDGVVVENVIRYDPVFV
jgi:hypothetical protein